MSDGGRDGGPPAFFLFELFAACCRNLVHASTAIVLRSGPLGTYPAGLFLPSGEGAGYSEPSLNAKQRSENASIWAVISVTMKRSAAVEDFEDQQREGAFVTRPVWPYIDILVSTLSMRRTRTEVKTGESSIRHWKGNA